MIGIAVVGLYVVLLVAVTVYAQKRTKTLDDFFLGSRGIGPWMSAFAYGTTYFSAVLIIGVAGKIGWSFGVSGLWIAVGNAIIGSLLAWLILAPRTREMTSRLSVRTLPEYLGLRYRSQGLKLFSSLIIFVFLVPYSASVYMGLSYLFMNVFHIQYWVALLLMTLLTGGYLLFGGYLAVNLSAVVQGIFMVVGMVVMLAVVITRPEVGGLFEGFSKLREIDPALLSPFGGSKWFALFSLVIMTSLGPWGLPQMVHKFYAIKDVRTIRIAAIASTVFALLMAGGAYYVGSLTHLFFTELPIDAGKPTPDLLIPVLIKNIMPEWIAALICVLVLSASMSTLAALVIISASVVSMDFAKTIKPDLTDKSSLTMMRIFCLIYTLLSFAIALYPPDIIVNLLSVSWGTVAGTFLAPYLYGLFWKRTTWEGAWAGALAGGVIPLFLLLVKSKLSPPEISCLAILIPLIIVPLVSLATQPMDKQFLQKIFGDEK